MLPRITLITPSFNQGPFIRQTLRSVLEQDYPALEYIVVDGGSTDDTPAILNEYRERITLIAEPDRGQTDALNKGLRRATGDVVGWLNSDDYLLPDALRSVGEFFANNPNAARSNVLWLTGDGVIVDAHGREIQRPVRQYKTVLRSLGTTFSLGLTNAICQPATFWRRSAHAQLGFLDETLRYTMDYDWWLRLATVQPPARLAKPLAAFRIHGQSKGGSQFRAQFAEDYQTLTRHQRNPLIRALHRMHNALIVGAYGVLK